MKSQKKWVDKFAIFLLIVFFAIVLTPCFSATIFREIDSLKCFPIVAERVGLEPTREGIFEYIHESLVEGMTRQDVIDNLEHLGPLEIWERETIEKDTNSEYIRILMCKNRYNNPKLLVNFTREGILTGYEVVEAP